MLLGSGGSGMFQKVLESEAASSLKESLTLELCASAADADTD
jgi:hypothetical protein